MFWFDEPTVPVRPAVPSGAGRSRGAAAPPLRRDYVPAFSPFDDEDAYYYKQQQQQQQEIERRRRLQEQQEIERRRRLQLQQQEQQELLRRQEYARQLQLQQQQRARQQQQQQQHYQHPQQPLHKPAAKQQQQQQQLKAAKQLQQRKQAIILFTYKHAAKTIQRAFRAYRERKLAERRNRAAVTLQRVLRGFSVRRQLRLRKARLLQLKNLRDQLEYVAFTKVGPATKVPFVSAATGKPNKLVLEAEENVTKLMMQIDGVLSEGLEDIRLERKRLIARAQEILAQLEAHKSRPADSFPADEPPQQQPASPKADEQPQPQEHVEEPQIDEPTAADDNTDDMDEDEDDGEDYAAVPAVQAPAPLPKPTHVAGHGRPVLGERTIARRESQDSMDMDGSWVDAAEHFEDAPEDAPENTKPHEQQKKTRFAPDEDDQWVKVCASRGKPTLPTRRARVLYRSSSAPVPPSDDQDFMIM